MCSQTQSFGTVSGCSIRIQTVQLEPRQLHEFVLWWGTVLLTHWSLDHWFCQPPHCADAGETCDGRDHCRDTQDRRLGTLADHEPHPVPLFAFGGKFLSSMLPKKKYTSFFMASLGGGEGSERYFHVKACCLMSVLPSAWPNDQTGTDDSTYVLDLDKLCPSQTLGRDGRECAQCVKG